MRVMAVLRGGRRARLAGVAVALSAVWSGLSSAPAARAWSNGVDGCNAYGTHDWILDEALEATGERTDWVRTRVALRATDDPDCRDGIDHASGTWWHVYDRWGDVYGGADEAAAVWFRRAQARLDAGRERAASKALGYLAHIVSDVANPLHTDQRDREENVHSSYEDGVDRRVSVYRFRYDGMDAASPARKVRRIASAAHRSYFELLREYDRSGYSRTVHRITKRQLGRASNGLADLLTSLTR
ncbi:MAG: hypothetical protein ACLGIB_06015 [Actinomycetota bacterium]